jgi:hypothetical protein
MEIVLLIAILAVAGSALYVAFTFRNHVTHNLDLVTKADLDAHIEKAVSDISGQTAAVGAAMEGQLRTAARDQTEQISELRAELTGELERLGRQARKLGTSLAWQRELTAGIENHLAGQEGHQADPRDVDALESALLEAEAYVARSGWGQPPRFFSLARKSSLVDADRELAAKLDDIEPDALIPVLQEDLPAGDPFDVLATVRWPEDVSGCVLVTEIIALPPAAEEDVPDDPVEAGQRDKEHFDGKTARLAVGVIRTGGYLCGLRLEGDDDVEIGADLADDIVTALLGTF